MPVAVAGSDPQLPVAVLDRVPPAAALLDPLRLEIVQRLREPSSATEVARTLGLPRQRVGYHVRELERHGLLAQVGERRKGNCVERLLQATARCYLIGPGALGPLGASPEEARDRLSSAYLIAVAARTVEQVAAQQPRATAAGKKLATFTLETELRFATPRDQAAFTEELATALAELIGRYHDDRADGGRRMRLAILGHPATGGKPPRPDDAATAAPRRSP